MTFALCATCNKAIFSWETPSMLPGLKPDVEWTHYVRADLGDPDSGKHPAVPCDSIYERVLYCATCHHRQAFGPGGWYCANSSCPDKVDKD